MQIVFRFLVALAVACMAAALFVGMLWARPTSAQRQVEQRRAALQLEQQRAAVERAEQLAEQRTAAALARERAVAPVQTAAAMVWAALPPFVALAVVIIGGLLIIDAYTQRRRALVAPDGAGLVPLPRAFVEREPAAALALLADYQTSRGEARIAAARNPILPQTLTFAPHYTSKNERPPEEPAALPAAAPVPSFAELLARGEIGPGRPIILGYLADGTAITGGVGSLVSTAIAGTSGSGKTTTTRALAGQLAAHGARLAIIDPHALADGGRETLAGTLAPLSAAFVCEPATEPRAFVQTVALVERELQRRLRGASIDYPLLCIIDEFTRVARDMKDDARLSALLEAIATEGRKVSIYAVLLGQTWSASRAGGTELRDTLASAYIHRIRRRQAQMLMGGGVDLPDTLQLANGRALLYRAQSAEVEIVTLPNTTKADLETLGRQLASPAAFRPASGAPFVTVEAVAREASPEGTREAASPASPQIAQALAMLRDGKSQSEVIRAVWRVKGGRAYTAAAEELRAAIARELGQ